MFRARCYNVFFTDVENDGEQDEVEINKGDLCVALEDSESLRQRQRMYVFSIQRTIIVKDEFMSDFEEIYD